MIWSRSRVVEEAKGCEIDVSMCGGQVIDEDSIRFLVANNISLSAPARYIEWLRLYVGSLVSSPSFEQERQDLMYN